MRRKLSCENRRVGSARLTLVAVVLLLSGPHGFAETATRSIIEFAAEEPDSSVSQQEMQAIYDEVKTPFKYGLLLKPEKGQQIDCPNVFRWNNKWYMVYVVFQGKIGYETHLASSEDLLHWTQMGKILPFRDDGWDCWQADGSIALIDPTWGGSVELQTYVGKYWMSYFGGAKRGYETDPLSIGMAWSSTPYEAKPWNRMPQNPVLSPEQRDARSFEKATLYKSHILWDKNESLGYPFVMYYNGKQQGEGVERIGMAVSRNLIQWIRFGDGPVIDNGKGISGDPQVVRIGDLWVMFYFGLHWYPGTFDHFACSRDLVHWTQWNGEPLLRPSEPYDKTFAHKPWLLKHDGIVYHFYCAVGKQGRGIALATSKNLRQQ